VLHSAVDNLKILALAPGVQVSADVAEPEVRVLGGQLGPAPHGARADHARLGQLGQARSQPVLHDHRVTRILPPDNQRQGCQMVCFRAKNPNFGKFWRALEWKVLVFFMTLWNILPPFGIFYGH
jgi:hypothetical protein